MYVFKVLLNTVLESSLWAILHQDEANTAPKMWEEMVSKAKQSTEAKHYSKKIFDYLNTITINDGLWRGTNKDFITHWCEQLHLYEEYSNQLTLTDTIKISLLQKAVSGAPYLEVIKTQTVMLSWFIDGVSEIDFAGYCELLISATDNYDAKNGPMMSLQNRKANAHMFSDSEPEYDDTIEAYGIDTDINTILINATRTHASCILRDHWNQISVDDHTIWRQIPTEDHTIILEGYPEE
jgi:hypothetical protein